MAWWWSFVRVMFWLLAIRPCHSHMVPTHRRRASFAALLAAFSTLLGGVRKGCLRDSRDEGNSFSGVDEATPCSPHYTAIAVVLWRGGQTARFQKGLTLLFHWRTICAKAARLALHFPRKRMWGVLYPLKLLAVYIFRQSRQTASQPTSWLACLSFEYPPYLVQ